MHSDTVMLYKLIILYMLDKVDFPLTNAQISNFMLDKEYTDYFTIQQVISELVDAEFIRMQTIRNSSHFEITSSGKETLSFFKTKISPAIQSDILEYLQVNRITLRNEASTLSDYYEVKSGEYMVNLKVKEKSSTVIEINISVPTKESAQKICTNWSVKNQEVYSSILAELLA